LQRYVISGVDRTLTLASLDPDRKEGGVHWVCFGVPALYEEQDEAFEMVSKTGYKDIWMYPPTRSSLMFDGNLQ
jgi:hypothetical protein